VKHIGLGHLINKIILSNSYKSYLQGSLIDNPKKTKYWRMKLRDKVKIEESGFYSTQYTKEIDFVYLVFLAIYKNMHGLKAELILFYY
jgi:hypothetical protein